MVQHCVNAASTDFGSYHSKKSCDAADVVGRKSSSIHNEPYHHTRTLSSMQAGSVDFVSNVLPISTRSDASIPTEQPNSSCKTNTAGSSSSSGYESVTSKSPRSFFSRLKRLIKRKSADYQLSSHTQMNPTSPILSFRHAGIQNSSDTRRNSLIRRKSSRKTFSPTIQHIPFLYGLKNCGNTCYINAIVQCLCHTEQIASYILRKTYEIDIRNIKNAIVDHPQPTNFKVTKIFVQLFQTLWNNSSNTTSKLLYDFKSLLANLNKQYSGNEQNDAQEFLLFLINTIHDELNLAIIRRYRQQNKLTITSSELAGHAWLEYIDVNQSIITSTFSAQLHSTLRCKRCEEESKTFEPYLLLSLPIPQKIIKPVLITVVFLNQSPKQLQIGLCLPITNTVKDVREAIAQQSNLDPNDIALVEIQQQNGFSQVFHDTEPITRLTQDVYAIQFPSSTSESTEQIASNTDKSSPSYVNLLVLNRVRYNSGLVERFGAPMVVRVPRQSDYRAIQLSIIKAQRSLIRDEVMKYAQDYVVFQSTVIDQYQLTSKQEYPILHDVQWPLYLDKIIEILDTYDGPELGPPHLQIYVNWHEKYLEEFLSKSAISDDKPDIHQSVAQARATLHQPTSSLISLADCFSLFTQSESLNYDDAWMCTHCRRKENGTVKNLKIWTTPSVLIIHLKRFCQTKMSNSKLTYPVEFPLADFDVKKFLSTTKNEEDNDDRQYSLYDLFAVCNHRGSISNGHYTAYCKNPITEKWFCYDDHLVSEIDPSRVCTPDAYILFYQRRDIPSSSSSSSQQQIDSIVQEFDERLTLDHASIIEEKKPLPLPRRLLTSQDVPCPMPRTRISQPTPTVIQQVASSIPPTALANDSNKDIISPWSQFNNQQYSNGEPEGNAVCHTTILP